MGAKPQRPLWASTGVKDPAYDDTRYVLDLVAPGIVNTMPEATLDAVADHGVLRGDTVRGTYDAARATLAALEAIGITYDEVIELLEVEGVDKFEASWQEPWIDSGRAGQGTAVSLTPWGIPATADCRGSQVPAGWSSSA